MKKIVIVFFGLLLLPGTAAATPRPLPFTYLYETLPKGTVEVEQYADYTPLKVRDANGNPVFYGASQLQTEFEYGISDRLELGLYVTFVPSSGSYTNVPSLTEGNGLKERLRLRLAEAGDWPVDVSLYGELVENERDFELEAKIILQRRIGDFRIAANLWGEREYERFDTHQGNWVINPTLGVTYQVTDWLDQPVRRVTGGEASPSISRVLERAAIARTEEVVIGLNEIIAGFGKRR